MTAIENAVQMYRMVREAEQVHRTIRQQVAPHSDRYARIWRRSWNRVERRRAAYQAAIDAACRGE